jgi:hypothetical protein
LELYRATTVRHSKHRTISGPILSSVLTLVSSPCSPLHPGVFLSRDNAVHRAFVFSGDGAAAELVAGVFFRPERRRLTPRFNLERPNQIQRPRFKDTGSAGVFVKESLEILRIKPAV